MSTVTGSDAARAIPDFPDYRATPRGGIFSSKSGRWRPIKPYYYKNGCGLKVALRRNGATCRPMLARVILETFTGPAPAGMVCVHKNGDSSDCRLENLRWGHRSETIRKPCRGELHPRARLGVSQVSAIREAYHNGAICSALARQYGVSSMAISCIVTKMTWKHVPDTVTSEKGTS